MTGITNILKRMIRLSLMAGMGFVALLSLAKIDTAFAVGAIATLTVVPPIAPTTTTPVPTLSEWGMIIFYGVWGDSCRFII